MNLKPFGVNRQRNYCRPRRGQDTIIPMGRGGEERAPKDGLRPARPSASKAAPPITSSAAQSLSPEDQQISDKIALVLRDYLGDGADYSKESRAFVSSLSQRKAAAENTTIAYHNDATIPGIDDERFVQLFAELSYLAMTKDRLVEGFDVEDYVVDSLKEAGFDAWSDENKQNKGADIYVAESSPSPFVIGYLESRGGKWHENLIYYKNQPHVRFPDERERHPLPSMYAEDLANKIENVSDKSKAEKESNDQFLAYKLMGMTQSLGKPRYGGASNKIDYSWVSSVLKESGKHTQHYRATLINHMVPEIDGENVNVETSLRELSGDLLNGKLKIAQDRLAKIADDPNPRRKALSYAPEMQVTKMGNTYRVTFCTHDSVSYSGMADANPYAEQIEFVISSRRVSVQVHVDELNTVASFTHPCPHHAQKNSGRVC